MDSLRWVLSRDPSSRATSAVARFWLGLQTVLGVGISPEGDGGGSVRERAINAPRHKQSGVQESGSHDLWASTTEAAGQQMQTAAPATPGRYHSPAKLSLEFSPPLPPPLPSRHVWSSPHPRELCKSECTCSLALLETSYPGRARLLQRRGCQLSVRLVLVLQNIHDL